jgi:hypothetical protein
MLKDYGVNNSANLPMGFLIALKSERLQSPTQQELKQPSGSLGHCKCSELVGTLKMAKQRGNVIDEKGRFRPRPTENFASSRAEIL